MLAGILCADQRARRGLYLAARAFLQHGGSRGVWLARAYVQLQRLLPSRPAEPPGCRSKAMRGAAAGAGAATNVGLPAGSCAVVGREAAPLDAAERAALQQLHNAVQGLQGPGPPVKLDP